MPEKDNQIAPSGEILFVKSAKNGIPNRDPLAESDARRLFDEEDGRISLSDVSIKRDVRDYVLAKFASGDDNADGDDDRRKRNFIFAREQRASDGKRLLGRKSLAEDVLEKAGVSGDTPSKQNLTKHAFDVRVFGIVYSVTDNRFKLTGPVQFDWAHSLHPVVTRYVQGTVVMPSEDLSVSEQGEEKGQTQGTIWSSYIQPFAVFAMPGVINHQLAKDSGMTEQDVELLLEALWRGTQNRQARGRGTQQPLFLLHVEYKDPLFRIGYIEEDIKVFPERGAWLGGSRPSDVRDVELDVKELKKTLDSNEKKIERIRHWVHPRLRLRGEAPGEKQDLW